ncbi:Chorismate mutase type II family protein [uncultured delta proteobacterium]|uniref:Bifunctional chorismate mutase/prephenate dehydratase n=1 Tax=uncultured delta proteobacterium TaxID=34034 RepID=A0A212K0N2_9DELT|nr:Chorismate mutase type II family protein [uncultured delta proteobacterium]
MHTTPHTEAAPPSADRREQSGLEGLRREIDAIDNALLELLNRRASASLAAGAVKREQGSPVFRPEREELLMETLLEKNSGPLPSTHLRTIYREILSSSRALQNPLKVAFLGPEGTFSHMAATEFLGNSMDFWAMPRFDDIFKAVENRDCGLGVIPLENSLHGTIVQSIDLFAAHAVHIQAEWFSRISHSLMSREAALAGIKTVYSHPQALGQCAGWLRANLPQAELISVDSTAAAAHKVLAERNAAAVGHGSLAPRLGLAVLARSIEDTSDNWTRFVCIGPEPAPAPASGQAGSGEDGAVKTSVLFTLADKPGALANVLQCFAAAGVNMNKLESRPMHLERWKYIFFCDVSCDLTDTKHAPLLDIVREHCHSFRILGAYPAGRYMQKGSGA